jgi:catechol 2,3-dioxygenase-like lactoylglutathione lyase family enzyme
MNRRLVHISILVNDYDEAIEFYTKKLDFILVEDSRVSDTKRWVLVKPKGESDCCLLLAKADGEVQENFVGNQSGGRVFLFLKTDDFERDHHNLMMNNIKIVREPSDNAYGKVLVFEDLYGNKWDLIGNNNHPPEKRAQE